MAYQEKEGSGVLFRNDKGDNPNRPDWRGTIMLGGTVYEISAWTKNGQRGDFLSISGKPKGERPQQQNSRPAVNKPQTTRQTFEDDDLPF